MSGEREASQRTARRWQEQFGNRPPTSTEDNGQFSAAVVFTRIYQHCEPLFS